MIFTDDERRALHALAAEYPLEELLSRSRLLEDRLHEAAFVFGKLEGCSYSKSGVSALLKYGWTEGGRSLTDALRLTDLFAALRFVFECSPKQEVCSRAFIMELVARANAHRPDAGVLSSITGTLLFSDQGSPSDSLWHDEELHRLTAELKAVHDPFERAAAAHCRLAVLFPKEECGAGIAQLMETAILLHENLTPRFPTEKDIPAYRKAVALCRETGGTRPYAEYFVRCCRHTIDCLLGRSAEQIEAVAEDERRLRAAWEKRRLRSAAAVSLLRQSANRSRTKGAS